MAPRRASRNGRLCDIPLTWHSPLLDLARSAAER
jgi:hypothetical protein